MICAKRAEQPVSCWFCQDFAQQTAENCQNLAFEYLMSFPIIQVTFRCIPKSNLMNYWIIKKQTNTALILLNEPISFCMKLVYMQ